MGFLFSVDSVSDAILNYTAYKNLVIGLAEKLALSNKQVLDLCPKNIYKEYIRETNNILAEALADKILED